MKNILTFAISQILSLQSNHEFDLYINRAMLHGNQSNNYSHLVFQSFMDKNQIARFQENIVAAYNLDEKRQQKYLVTHFDDMSEISLSLDVFDVQISKHTTKTGEVFVQIPLIDPIRYQTMAVITFCT